MRDAETSFAQEPVTEVYDNIYRIGVELPGNPLRETNSYFIRGDESDLLIDTGFRRKECREALERGLRILGSDPARRSVLCTHLHADHSGLADLFAGPEQRVFMGRVDRVYRIHISDPDHRERTSERYLKEGFPRDVMNLVYGDGPAFTQALPAKIELRDARFTPLEDGQEIRVGKYVLKTILTPGHTPGNCMFWMEKEKVMFTGDHVLFDITPNITEWLDVEDSLGDYLASLRRVRDYPVERALPGHRAPGDYRERIDALLTHHERRLAETYSIICNNPGLNGYEIASRMKWKIHARNWEEFPASQKWFAVGECLSHLNYLKKRNKIIELAGEDGLRRYRAV